MLKFIEIDEIPEKGKKQGRPKKKTPRGENFWFSLAKMTAEKSDCPRKKVGAIIVHNEEAIASGYNHHFYPGECPEGKESCTKSIHAEVSALYSGVKIPFGAVMYTTLGPCPKCLEDIPSWMKIYSLESYDDYVNSKLSN